MDVGKKESWFYLTRDTKGWGHWGMAKTFFIFLSPEAAGLVVPRESKNFVSRGQLSWGRVKIFVLRGCVSTPEGQKFFTLPKDNWPKETKFLLSRGTTRPKAEGENKLKKFLPSRSSPYFGHLEANKSNCLFFPKSIQFFLKLNLIFIDY